MIINITDQAISIINQMIFENSGSPKIFRVYIRRVSAWHGPVFDVALDESTKDDEIFRYNDYDIIISKDLASKITSIDIYYKPGISNSGFRVITDYVL